MSRRLFGTDGVRGRVNDHPMTVEVALSLGKAVGHFFNSPGSERFVVIGCDTRSSGSMIEAALVAGLTSVGCDAGLMGVAPTPAVAHLAASSAACAGLVISASHNPYWDNGIKVFKGDGFKLSDDEETQLEALCLGDTSPPAADPEAVGRARAVEPADGGYLDFLRLTGADCDLSGLRIAVDCAHGATYRFAPVLFEELGATVVPLGTEPTGININDGVGATHPKAAAKFVAEGKADLGITFDGDGDRVIFVDETGSIVDGDELLAIMALAYKQSGKLRGDAIAATVMSNIGLEVSLRSHGIGLVRTDVGDRYVVQAMRDQGLVIGGEQSGHMVCLDKTTTGDGIVAAITVLEHMTSDAHNLSTLRKVMTRFPQVLKNVLVREKRPLDELPPVSATIAAAEAKLGSEGRVLVRYSGTEPKARVMVEGPSQDTVEEWAGRIADSLKNAIGQAE